MTAEEKKVCPTCQGKKVIEGVCESSSEWSGAGGGEIFVDDMGYTPTEKCPIYNGTGLAKYPTLNRQSD